MMNWDKEMLKELSGIRASGARPSLLLNSCCGPCSTSVLEQLIQVFDVTVHFYNPNLDTQTEYMLRLENQKSVLKALQVPLDCLLEHGWQKHRWEPVASMPWDGEGGTRCRACLAHRLEHTAQIASERGFQWFASTLSVSPHKDAAFLNQIGMQLEKSYPVRYLASDFKKRGGYQRSTVLSREWGLYRQNYCGCTESRSITAEEDE